MTPTNSLKTNSVAIPISYSGAYLYRAPHTLELMLDKHLAVVFTLKGQNSTGLVLFSHDLATRDLLSELELLYLKIKSKLKIQTSDISLKIFGLSHGATHILEVVQSWARSVNISISAIDVGKRVTRNLSVNCENGRVAVTYGEMNQSQNKLIFLSEGTARNRIPLAKVHSHILILTKNSVQEQITKAAIEEYPAWAAVTVDNVSQFLNAKISDKSHWSVVLCFHDIKDEKGLEKFLGNVVKSHPSTQLRWVGPSLPDFHKNTPELKLLPPIDYELLPDFKKMLKRAVFDSNLALNFESVKVPVKRRK